jgi:Telomere resolvase
VTVALLHDVPTPLPDLTPIEREAYDWIRKGRPDLSLDEQLAEARRIASTLPELRQPKEPGASVKTVRDRLADFMSRLRAVDRADRRRISGMVAREKRELFTYYRLRYVRSSLTDYRQAVRDQFGADHPAVTYLHLNRGDVGSVNRLDRAQVKLRQTALRPIDSDALIDKAIDLLRRDTVAEVGVGLVLLTGRRPIELFKTGAFEYVDDEHVRFVSRYDRSRSGQAKTKNASTARIEPYIIPVLTHADRIIAAFERLSDIRPLEDETPERINNLTQKPMNSVTGQYGLVDDFGEKLQVKELRAAYAEIAFAYFAPPTVTKNAFFHQILGHAETDETSAGSYMKFHLIGHLGDALADNELARRDLALKLYRDRAQQTDPKQIEYRNQRIALVEELLDFTGREVVRRAAGESVDPAIAERARLVRALAANLSPAQERLIRDVANGRDIPTHRQPGARHRHPSEEGNISGAKDRKTLEILRERGIVALEMRNDRILRIRLTSVGHEVRAELPRLEEQLPRALHEDTSSDPRGHAAAP